MDYHNKKAAGLLLMVGVAQFILAIIISEAVYSGYSVRQVVSDLGDWSLAGNYAAIFNASIILSGILAIAGAYFIQREFKNRLFTSLLFIYGIGGVGVGLFAENISLPVHSVFALVAMVSGAASAIMSYKFVKSPLSFASVILGAVSLSPLILFILGQGNSDFYIGLSLGGMERLIIYPILLWVLGFSAYLIGNSSDTPATSKT